MQSRLFVHKSPVTLRATPQRAISQMSRDALVWPLQALGLRGRTVDVTSAPVSRAEARPAYSRWEPVWAFLLTLLVLALITPRILTYLDPVTGDEPFYLMTAISMLDDHDLNECNNYRQRDEGSLYPSFYTSLGGGFAGFPQGWQGWKSPFPLPPHPAQLVPPERQCVGANEYKAIDADIPLPPDGTGSELYSKHGLGLSLLVLPAFSVGGRLLVVLFLNLLGALLAANVYLLAREGTGKMLPAVLTWAAFAFTVPQLPYSFLIFPELPAALFVLYAFRRIRLWSNNVWQVAAIGFSMAFLPWLHYRFIPVSVGLFLYYLYQDYTHRRADHASRITHHELSGAGNAPRRSYGIRNDNLNYVLILGQPLVSAILLMLFFYHRYGQVIPNAADHAGINDLAGTLRGAAGLLLDEQWGLLVAAPIFILCIVGLVLMGAHRAWRKDLLWISIVFVPYFLVIANYAQWWGEWCPPARYMASTLPLLALPFAVSLSNIRSGAYKGIYALLMLLSLFSTWAFVYQPHWMYNQPFTVTKDNTLLPGRNQALTIGLPDLLGGVLPDFSASDLATSISDNLPSFVFPYFAYAYEEPPLADDAVAVAWRDSAWPFSFMLLVIAVSLALAWLSRTRAQGYAQVSPLPLAPDVGNWGYTTEGVTPQAADLPPPPPRDGDRIPDDSQVILSGNHSYVPDGGAQGELDADLIQDEHQGITPIPSPPEG